MNANELFDALLADRITRAEYLTQAQALGLTQAQIDHSIFVKDDEKWIHQYDE
jgi:hypothetical protein